MPEKFMYLVRASWFDIGAFYLIILFTAGPVLSNEMAVIQQALSQHISQNPESQGQVIVIYVAFVYVTLLLWNQNQWFVFCFCTICPLWGVAW